MHRTQFKMALTNGRGLGTVLFFSGLEKPMVIAPSWTDESMLTRQLFYFVSRQDCVAWVTFDQGDAAQAESDGTLDKRLESIVDNYLFALSRQRPEWRLTSKLHEYVLRPDMSDDLHFGFDNHNTECLALDRLNDKSIRRFEVEGADGFVEGGFDDFLPLREILDGIRTTYEREILKALSTRVRVTTVDHETLGTGTHVLPIATLAERPLTFDEMDLFRVLKGARSGPEPDRQFVSDGGGTRGYWIPKITIEHSVTYDPQLLAYYFCALRDPSPIVQFKNYYNVLEFFFDTAAARAGLAANRLESEHLRALIKELMSVADVASLLAPDSSLAASVRSDIRTASGVVIRALDPLASEPVDALAARIYAIRNACVHLKHTRKGQVEARFVPSLDEEKAIEGEVPLMREIAARCIERNGAVSWVAVQARSSL
jgi:hypothetical protein